ncbi:MAG: isoprenylcysteine carboxyl methyltransferase family protein [Kiloniellaceae bacterium]
MSLPQAVVLLVALQRLAELAYARRNTKRLRAAGGIEAGAGHYPLFVLLHGSWLAALFFLIPRAATANWWLLGLYLLLQAGRLWVIASLGPRWTTRIIVPPGAPLVRRGPYRFLRHPNYLIVAAEIAVLPLAFGAWELALVFTALNIPLLAYRIRVEERALAPRRRGDDPA